MWKFVLVICLAATVFLGPAVLGNKVLSQADQLYFLPPWSVCRPADLLRPANPLLSDQTLYFYPYREFARHQLYAGRVPLWNPFILMGTPFLANMQSAVFSPFSIFSYVGNFKRSFAWSALCRLIIAGVGAYCFCRLLAVSEVGSVLAGIGFMLCTFNVVWLNYPHTNVSVLLPWALVAIERVVTHQDRRSVLLMATVVAALLLGGHPETVLHVALGVVAFFFYRVGQEWRGGRSNQALGALLAHAIGGALLGLGLASVVVVPFAELLWQSGIWETRGSIARNWFVLEPSTLLTAVAPDLFGNPVLGKDYGPSNYNERVAYDGLFPLFLALLSLQYWRQDSRVRFFLAWGLFCLLIVYGMWPVFDLVTWLPFLHHSTNSRLLLFWQFCVSVLAGIGADLVMRTEKKDVAPHRLLVLAGVLGVLPFFLWLVPQLGIVKQNPRTLYGALYPVVIGGIAFSLLRLLRKGKLSPQGWGIMACAFTFLDLFVVGHKYNPTVKANRVFTCLPGSIRFLQSQEGIFRVAAMEGFFLAPNTAMVYGLQDLRGYELPAPERLVKFFTDGLKGRYDGAHYEIKDLTTSILRLLSLANVRYLISAQELAGSGLDLLKVYSGEVQVYENPGFLPRAFIVHQTQVASHSQIALEKVMDDEVNLKEVGIIEVGNSPVNLQAMAEHDESHQSGPCSDSAEITHYEPQRVRLQVNLCEPGLVVLTDTYYSGWKVYVDGVEQHLYRTDYLFRGVYSDRGQHKVRFVYDSLSYKTGLALSAASAIICLLILVKSKGKKVRVAAGDS